MEEIYDFRKVAFYNNLDHQRYKFLEKDLKLYKTVENLYNSGQKLMIWKVGKVKKNIDERPDIYETIANLNVKFKQDYLSQL